MYIITLLGCDYSLEIIDQRKPTLVQIDCACHNRGPYVPNRIIPISVYAEISASCKRIIVVGRPGANGAEGRFILVIQPVMACPFKR